MKRIPYICLISAFSFFMTGGILLVGYAKADVTCYVSNLAGNPNDSPINFPGVSYDSLTYWRTYGTIAQLFKPSSDATITSIKLKNLSVTGDPGGLILALMRTSTGSSPYWTPFPLSVQPEGLAIIDEAGPIGEWVTFRLNKPVSLTTGTHFYAIMLHVDWPDYPVPIPPAAPTDYWSVQRGFTNPYNNGRIVYFTNSGWATMSDDESDLLFEVCFDTDVSYETVTPVTGGEATLVPDKGILGTVTPIAVPDDNTPNVDFPYGLFDLSISDLVPGGFVTLTLTFDQNIAVGTKWWKYLGSGDWISLDIGSDDGDNVITVTLQDNGLGDTNPVAGTIGDPGGPGLQHPIDLDIKAFQVSKGLRIGGKNPKSVNIKLTVKNNGAYDYDTRFATIIGEQNGSEVYNETLEVFDAVGGGSSTFIFPPYTPITTGNITWTATIFDNDPDVDIATALTKVN